MTASAMTRPARIHEVPADRPWAQWQLPQIYRHDIGDLSVHVDLIKRNDDKEEDSALEQKLVLRGSGETIGYPSRTALKELASRVGMPVDFIERLPLYMQADVIQEVIDQASQKRDMDFSLAVQDDTIINIIPGWRETISHADVCESTFKLLKDVYGGTDRDIEIAEAEILSNGNMLSRFLTPVQQPVTRRVGDILQMGVQVSHAYGITLDTCLFTRRLVCLNGATSIQQEFSWTQRSMGKPEHQLAWLRAGVNEVVAAFDLFVERAKLMAETTFNGNPHEVLKQRAEHMRLPRRHWRALLDAFDEEEGDTEWHLANAFTRLATHGGMALNERARLENAAGMWIQDFDMVNARLPRPMAARVGAIILGEGDETGVDA